jgi:uncharacterized peroxidase-related enzyme
MARIAPLPREKLPFMEERFKESDRTGRHIPNCSLTLAHRPEIYMAWQSLRKTIVGPGLVSEELKSFVAQVASASAGCNYCWAHNAFFAEEMGVAAEREEAVWQYETSPLITDAERSALRVAQLGAQVPNAVEDEDIAEMKKYYSDAQIVEIVAVIAVFGFLNRFNDTMATELEDKPAAAGERYLAPHGWQLGKHAKKA